MRLHLLFLPALVIASALHAQTPVNWIKKKGPLGGYILDIEVDPSTGNIFLLDGDNRPFVSRDNAGTWERISVTQGDIPFYDIEITNNTIFLVGYWDLYASTDGGATFPKRMTDVSPFQGGYRLKRMPVSGNLVVLAFNGIYHSTDNGVTWTLKGSLSGLDQGYHLAVNNVDQIFILKQNATFELRPFRSANSGVSFSEMSTGIPAGHHVNSLSVKNDGSGLYAVTNTDIFTSSDGSSWTTVKNGSITDATINDVYPGNSYIEFTADGLGMFFVDNVNHKLHSKGVGDASWTLRSLDFPSPTLIAPCASAKDYTAPTTAKAYFGTPSGVFKTITGGASVEEGNVGLASVKANQILINRYYNNIFLKTKLPVTNADELLKSQDEGNTWTRISGLASPIDIVTQTDYALFALVNTALYRSYDQGTNWSPLSPPTGSFLWVGGIGSQKVFGLYSNSNPISFYYSADNGNTWTATPVSITGFPTSFSIYQDISFASENRMFLKLYDYTLGAEAYYRIDFVYNASDVITSATATQITTVPIPMADIEKMDAANGKIFIYQTFGASADRVAVSSDGGVSWATHSIPESDRLFVVDNGYLFLADNSFPDKLYLSRDDGATFLETVLPESIDIYDVADIALNNSGVAYLALNGDYLYQSVNTVVIPASPNSLAEVGKSATAVALEWVDLNQYERDIVIERSVNGTDFAGVGQVSGWNSCDGNKNYFIDSNVLAGTTYHYRVKAKNAAGESAPTSSIAVTTLATCAQSIPENRSWSAINAGGGGYSVLGAPVSVGIKHLGGGEYQISNLSLTLTGMPEASTFFESCGQTVVGQKNDLTPNGNGTWNGTTLTLKWRACGTGNTETISLTLNAADPAPAKPIALYAYVVTNTTIEVKWPSSFYEKTYILERSLSPGSGFSQIASVDYPAKSYIDNGPFTTGITYYYRLKSRNGNVSPLESSYSDVVAVPFKQPNFLVANNAITNYNESATLGSIWVDFNNDGNDDYFTMKFDDANQVARPVIIKNLGSGNFEPIPIAVADAPYFFPSVVDVDNDGFADLVLSGDGKRFLEILKGNGDFTFTKVPSGQLGQLAVIEKQISATSWGDINDDGLPDLLILNQEDGSFTLYRQNADHSFTKIAEGSPTNDTPYLGIWADYDNDGDQDVLIAGPSGLQRNNGDGTFTAMSDIDATNARAAAWGDYNNDGHMDLFVGTAANNALYQNNGDGSFTKDVSTSISEANFTISAAWGDYNNDGYLDLITVSFGTYQSRLFLRDPSVTPGVAFKKIITEKINDLSVSHYGVAHADPDGDGLLDLALSAFIFDDSYDGVLPTNNNFYKNNNSPGNWSEVRLKPKNGNKEALGAKIRLITTGMVQTREIAASTSLASRNSQVAHFGLGSAASITNIEVTWPNGNVQNYANPPINQLIIIDEDLAAPAITFTPPASTPKGANLNLAITATDDNAVNSVKVFARKISTGGYSEIAATKGTGDTWNAVLDMNTHFDEIGTEYYIEARDNAGNMTRHPAGLETNKTYLLYSEADASIPPARLSFGGQLSDWRIIAIPFNLGSSNTVSAVFDEFSGLTDKVDYRIITYQNQTSWLELSSSSALQRSKGYFINIKNSIADIGVGTDLTAPANTRSNLESINLNQGWNMIGNPYLTQVSWSDVAALNGLTGSAAELKKYNGAGYSVQTQILEPYEGAFVFVDNAIADVVIPFKGQTAVGGRQKGFASLGTDISNETWGLNMKLSQSVLSYELGSIGMAPDANPSFDVYDDVTPPRFFNYLELNFDHPEHHARVFTRDVVPTQPSYTWDFTVDSNLGGIAELSWDNAPLAGAGKEIFLLDVATQQLINMKEKGLHRFDPTESRQFRIYYGDHLNLAPERVHVGKAYPNPTTGITTIGFSLPETGGLNQTVTLDLLDALGRTVGTLKSGVFDPGYYEATFDATEIMNGFYTYRLSVRNRQGFVTEVNKLIIK